MITTPTTFKEFVELILGLVSKTIPLFLAIALFVFIWGLALFILHADDTKKREDGKRLMVWGVIGFFVMFSFWGLIGLLLGTLGFDFLFPQLKTRP